jgi:hypothetical protein
MASQEEIELSRLRVHRFPDHYTARAGATSRPVSQISTIDQASESAEAELVQYPTSIFPDSWSPEEEEEQEQDAPTLTRKQSASVPWTLRRLSLLGLIAFLIALIVALEVLYFFSNKNQGLVSADRDATYLWRYLPTASKWNRLCCDHSESWTINILSPRFAPSPASKPGNTLSPSLSSVPPPNR